ncbi:hypothetical protein E5D57_009897 [Metarhizium anisopliae]|nr:hypothetical protein E5D57_009897 [Metarhizium anisopliae]
MTSFGLLPILVATAAEGLPQIQSAVRLAQLHRPNERMVEMRIRVCISAEQSALLARVFDNRAYYATGSPEVDSMVETARKDDLWCIQISRLGKMSGLFATSKCLSLVN